MNKKGNFIDVFDYGIIAIFLGIIILFTYYIIFTFHNSISSIPIIANDTIAMGYSSSVVTKFPQAFDFIIPLIYIAFLGFSVWASSKIESSHKFLFVAIIMSLIFVLFAMFLENVWYEFATTTFSSFISLFPFTDFILNNARYFMLFYGIVVSIIIYSKVE